MQIEEGHMSTILFSSLTKEGLREVKTDLNEDLECRDLHSLSDRVHLHGCGQESFALLSVFLQFAEL